MVVCEHCFQENDHKREKSAETGREGTSHKGDPEWVGTGVQDGHPYLGAWDRATPWSGPSVLNQDDLGLRGSWSLLQADRGLWTSRV